MSESPILEINKSVQLFIPPPDKIAGWRRSGNIVFLSDSEALYVIDSGGPSVKKQLIRIVNNLEANDKNPVHCIHTHGHIDHMAGAQTLLTEFKAEIWASEAAIPFVENQSPIYMEKEKESIIVSHRELFTAPSWFVKAAMLVAIGRSKPLSSVKPIDEKSNIGTTGFHPIELPGHHQGHFGFYNEDSGILISGDLIDPRHRMKPSLTSPSSDFEGMMRSMDIVLKLEPEIILPGHGEPVNGKETVMDSILIAKDTMQTASDRVIEILETQPSTLPELSRLMQRMGLGPGDVFRRMFIHSILHHLVNIGKVNARKISRGRTEFSI
ncbi:MAG: MBL fold metallo-hydrolase [Candidatus Thorarchaeota archaeon]